MDNSINYDPWLRDLLVDTVPKLRCYAWALLDGNDVIKPDDLVEVCLLDAKSWADRGNVRSPNELLILIFKELHARCVSRLQGTSDFYGGHKDREQGKRQEPATKGVDRIEHALRSLPRDQRAVLLLIGVGGSVIRMRPRGWICPFRYLKRD